MLKTICSRKTRLVHVFVTITAHFLVTIASHVLVTIASHVLVTIAAHILVIIAARVLVTIAHMFRLQLPCYATTLVQPSFINKFRLQLRLINLAVLYSKGKGTG